MASDVRQQREPRVAFEQPVWVGSRDTTGPIRRLWASNLSRGGMFVRTPEPLTPGDCVLVALEGSQELLPLAEAVVIWQRPVSKGATMDSPPGVGLAFTQLKPSGDRVIASLLEEARQATHPANSSAWPEPTTPTMPAAGTPAGSPGPAPSAGRPAVPFFGRRYQPQVFWTELLLPNRPRIRVRAVNNELRFDFAPQQVARVSQDETRILVTLQD